MTDCIIIIFCCLIFLSFYMTQIHKETFCREKISEKLVRWISIMRIDDRIDGVEIA